MKPSSPHQLRDKGSRVRFQFLSLLNFSGCAPENQSGEDVTEDGGKVNISGHVSVMAINALIAKTIFDANPRQEFFVAESFPLDWMYPHLEPHGLIMKLNRQPLEKMPDNIMSEGG